MVHKDCVLKLQGVHLNLTPAIEDYAKKKFSHISVIKDHPVGISLTLSIQKNDHCVDAVCHIGHTKVRIHTVTHQSVYEAIDIAHNRLVRVLSRYKSRLVEHHQRGTESSMVGVQIAESGRASDDVVDTIDVNEAIEKETEQRLIHQWTPDPEDYALKSLTHDEAVMKMDLSQDAFLLFRSLEDSKVKLIYKRNDGRYGLISPE